VSNIKQFSSLVSRACAGATDANVLIVVLALQIRERGIQLNIFSAARDFISKEIQNVYKY